MTEPRISTTSTTTAPWRDCGRAAAEIARLTTETPALRIRCAGLQDRLDDQADAADRWGETREADIVERDETIAQLRQVIQQLTDETYEQRSELYRRGWRDPAPDQHETDADDLNALDMHDLNALDPTTRRSK